jgi:hypothetical protein
MTGNPCAAFFEKHKDDPDFVNKLPPPEESVAWETLSAKPALSPKGPVTDDERVRRRIITPTHIDSSGAPTPLCFKDAWDKGLSVDREYRPEAETIRDAEQWIADQEAKAPGNGKQFHGLATAAISDLRALTLEGRRAFAVFDTAMAENDAHADVCGVGKPSKNHRTDLRATLWRTFRKSWE